MIWCGEVGGVEADLSVSNMPLYLILRTDHLKDGQQDPPYGPPYPLLDWSQQCSLVIGLDFTFSGGGDDEGSVATSRYSRSRLELGAPPPPRPPRPSQHHHHRCHHQMAHYHNCLIRRQDGQQDPPQGPPYPLPD
ncbi:hypothetical protein Tco_1102502 [Tanacetum coccineum]